MGPNFSCSIGTEFLMGVGSLFDFLSYYFLLTDIRRKKSINGLSFDFIIVNCLECLTSIMFQIPYLSSSRVAGLYRLRNPVYYKIVMAPVLTMVEIMKLIVAIGLVLQLVKYSHTRKSDQCISLTLRSLLAINVAVVGFISLRVFKSNSFTLNYLDFLETLWISNQFYRAFKLLPQLFMNFTNFSYTLAPNFVNLFTLSNAALLSGKVCSFLFLNWYSIPINYYTTPCILINSSYSMILYLHSKHYGAKNRLTRNHQN